MNPRIPPAVAGLPLVDHHCHPIVAADLDSDRFERMLTEADTVSPLGATLFDSLIGLAVRQWCAPVLDLPVYAPASDYLARRSELGFAEVNRRLVAASGIAEFLVDDGVLAPGVVPPSAASRRIVRLEQVAEDVARSGVSAGAFAAEVRSVLAARAVDAVGCKSIAAYRVGLGLSGERPSAPEVRSAAGSFLARGDFRVADEVLHRFLIWCGLDLGLPVQIHVGLGDRDLDLHRCDPLLLTDLLRATEPLGVPIVLLHNYPYHRHSGYLAQVFPHVFADLSLTVHNVGARASAVLAEALELIPFGKFLFATDAFGLAELYLLGAHLFRQALSDFLRDLPDPEATRIAGLIGSGNAERVYRLRDL